MNTHTPTALYYFQGGPSVSVEHGKSANSVFYNENTPLAEFR